jgi:phenylalanyl-tRNA synthetase beta chain
VETSRLAGASYRQGRRADLEAHFREVKGALEELFRMLNMPAPMFETATDGAAPWEQDGQFARLSRNGKALGALGYLSGPVLDEFGANAQVVWFDLDFDALDGPVYPDVTYEPASPFPGSWFDMSIVWPEAESFAALQAKLDRFAHPLVQGREFIGHYKGKGLEPGQASYTFRYWIGSPERTLSGDEIQEVHNSFVKFLKSEGLGLR